MEKGEKMTSYFFRSLKDKHEKETIKSISIDGNLTSDEGEITDAFNEHFHNIFNNTQASSQEDISGFKNQLFSMITPIDSEAKALT